MKTTVLAISAGDPAGVGPMVAARATARHVGTEALVLFGDSTQLARELAAAGNARPTRRVDADDEMIHPVASEIVLADVGEVDARVVDARAPTAEGGAAQLAALDAAIRSVRAGRTDAIVTGPTSKAAIALTGAAFTGQTEHLARACGLSADAVTMMFLGPRLRVSLATTHLSIRALPDALTKDRIVRAAVHLAEALLAIGEPSPAIVMTGLNPHAGEHGLFGDEETRVLGPAIAEANEREPFRRGACTLQGPAPAEACFRHAHEDLVQGVVAMFHDQATIASKLLDWTSAVNVTWGLPFVRTSVDHGVAYDAATRGEANAAGMVAAMDMALKLVRHEATR